MGSYRGDPQEARATTAKLLFIDCSNGMDRQLRALAEQSLDDLVRRIERFPIVLMALRLLDHSARYDPNLKKLNIPTGLMPPIGWTCWANFCTSGGRRPARFITSWKRKAEELAERLEEERSGRRRTAPQRSGTAQPRLEDGRDAHTSCRAGRAPRIMSCRCSTPRL